MKTQVTLIRLSHSDRSKRGRGVEGHIRPPILCILSNIYRPPAGLYNNLIYARMARGQIVMIYNAYCGILEQISNTL